MQPCAAQPGVPRPPDAAGANNLDSSSHSANALRETSIEAADRDLSNIQLSTDSAVSRYGSAADAALAQGNAQAWGAIGSATAGAIRSGVGLAQSAGYLRNSGTG